MQQTLSKVIDDLLLFVIMNVIVLCNTNPCVTSVFQSGERCPIMKRIFISSLGVNLFVMVLNVCTGSLTARLLGPFGRGELAVATRWSGLFIMLFTIGLPGAVIYLGKQFTHKQNDYFGAYIILGTLVGLVGFVVGELVLPHLLIKQPPMVLRLAQISMCALPFGVLADGLIGSLQTLNKFNTVLFIRVLNELGTLLVILGLLLFGEYGITHYLVSNIMWSIMIFLVTLVWACLAIKPSFSKLFVHTKQLFMKGFQIYAGSIVNVFGGNLDQLVISLFLSPYTLGLYAVCVSVSGLLPSLITGTVQLFLWPKLMDMDMDDRRRSVELLHSSLFYASLIMTAIMGGLLPVILPLVYGQRYSTAVFMGELLLLSAPMTIGYVVIVNYLSTLGKFNVVTIAEISGLVLGISVTYPLSHVWAGVGAAIGVVSTSTIKWLFLMRTSSHHGISKWALLRPDTKIVKFVWGLITRRVISANVEGSKL